MQNGPFLVMKMNSFLLRNWFVVRWSCNHKRRKRNYCFCCCCWINIYAV